MFSSLSSYPAPPKYTLDLHVSLQRLLLSVCHFNIFFLRESFAPTLFSCPHLPLTVSLLQSGFQSPTETPAVLISPSCWKRFLLCFVCSHLTHVSSTSQATSHLSPCLLLSLSRHLTAWFCAFPFFVCPLSLSIVLISDIVHMFPKFMSTVKTFLLNTILIYSAAHLICTLGFLTGTLNLYI